MVLMRSSPLLLLLLLLLLLSMVITLSEGLMTLMLTKTPL